MSTPSISGIIPNPGLIGLTEFSPVRWSVRRRPTNNMAPSLHDYCLVGTLSRPVAACHQFTFPKVSPFKHASGLRWTFDRHKTKFLRKHQIFIETLRSNNYEPKAQNWSIRLRTRPVTLADCILQTNKFVILVTSVACQLTQTIPIVKFKPFLFVNFFEKYILQFLRLFLRAWRES